MILDNERWKQADVPTELQSLVDSLVDGKIKLKFPLFKFIIFLNLIIFGFLINGYFFNLLPGVYPRGKEPNFSIGMCKVKC